MDSRRYWIGFNLVKGIGAVRLKAVLDYFGSLEIAWNAPADALQAAGLPQKSVDSLLEVRKKVNLESVCEYIEKRGIHVVTWEDEGYPRRLKEINQAPPVLYIRGSIEMADDWAVAVVGTRRVTPYGRQVAIELSRFLAQNGVTVVSGLARGVDAVAHSSALQAGGRTIAVLGNGVDVVYPPEHQKLSNEIIQSGALISDYPVGTPPESQNFPPRNRIISGLSLATVVVEAGEKSGALITAEFAVDQGREVFAVPGSILAAQSAGTNHLIEQGARPLLKMSEILEVLKLDKLPEMRETRRVMPASDYEKKILNVLSQEPAHIDAICLMSGLPIQEVSATLTMMELKGLVNSVGGMNYTAAREAKSSYGVN
jgi:DNA processing protein